MPPRVKRNYLKKANTESENSNDQNLKEKGRQQFNLCRKSVDELVQQRESNSEEMFEKLRSSPMTQNVNMKPLSFWSKKLQDLESEKTVKKVTKFGLYEFSASEDSSYSPTKKRKKPPKKYPIKKKKPTEFPITIKKSKKTDTKSKSQKSVKKFKASDLGKEITTAEMQPTEENKENNDLDTQEHKKKKFSLDSAKILTSTPAPTKSKKLLETSNFLFLSPIERKYDVNLEHPNEETQHSPLKTLKILNKKIPEKTEEVAEVNCRVLRSRKILVT